MVLSQRYIIYCFDATSAGYKAVGRWGGDSDQHIVNTIRHLLHLYEARYSLEIQDWHIEAHKGHPGNEAANSLAIAAPKAFVPPKTCPVVETVLKGGIPAALPWAWVFWKPEWTGYWKNMEVNLPARPEQISHDALPSLNYQKEERDEIVTANIRLRVVSANVLTLDTKSTAQNSLKLARLQALQRQCDETAFGIVGIQESRARRSPPVDQDLFWTFSAEANARGCYGVQLWFSKRQPYGTDPEGRPLYWQRHFFKFVHSDPRCLVLLVEAPFLRIVVVSGHAPCTDDVEAAKWWDDLRRNIPRKLHQLPWLMCVDANAHVGSIESRAIGGCGAETQDDNGDFIP